MDKNISHRELVLIGAKWLNKKAPNIHYRCQFVCAELVCAGLVENPDIFGMSPYSSVKIEVKVSRSDFLSDKKKRCHSDEFKNQSVGIRRLYLTPKGLLSLNELPEGWGLAEYDGKNIEIVKHSDVFESDSKSLSFIYHSVLRRQIKAQVFDFRKVK